MLHHLSFPQMINHSLPLLHFRRYRFRNILTYFEHACSFVVTHNVTLKTQWHLSDGGGGVVLKTQFHTIDQCSLTLVWRNFILIHQIFDRTGLWLPREFESDKTEPKSQFYIKIFSHVFLTFSFQPACKIFIVFSLVCRCKKAEKHRDR